MDLSGCSCRRQELCAGGDTAKSAGLVAAAHGADVLVHEAQANHLVAAIGDAAAAIGRERIVKIMHDIPSYHTTPVQAAEVANEAGVRLLVLSHLNPPPSNRIAERLFVRGVSRVRPDGWIVGDDGLAVELPEGSNALTVTHLKE